ncbi:MAG: sporulation integral membrane protein YlbJ [Clostridium sp.]
MTYFLLLLFLFVVSFIFLKKYKFNGLITFISTTIIVYIILQPKQCIELTLIGCKLFFYSVFPSLFPFLVLINMIICCGGIYIYSKLLGNALCKPLFLPKSCSLAILVSFFCGYPLGARYSSVLYSEKLINFSTYQRLLNIASNGSPLFIVGTVGTAMLTNPKIGYLLLISNMLSCIVIALLTIKKTSHIKVSTNFNTNNNHSINLGQALKTAIEDALKTSLSIGGFIIIFSVLIGIINDSVIFNTAITKISYLFNIPPDGIKGFFLGLIEVTNGCNILANGSLSLDLKLILISFLISFSGLSITSQVYSMIYKFKVNFKKYFSLKIIQGIISGFFTYVICKIPLFTPTLENFNNSLSFNNINSQIYIIIVICTLFPFLLFKLLKKTNRT